MEFGETGVTVAFTSAVGSELSTTIEQLHCPQRPLGLQNCTEKAYEPFTGAAQETVKFEEAAGSTDGSVTMPLGALPTILVVRGFPIRSAPKNEAENVSDV